jgi:hypothetical protein
MSRLQYKKCLLVFYDSSSANVASRGTAKELDFKPIAFLKGNELFGKLSF